MGGENPGSFAMGISKFGTRKSKMFWNRESASTAGGNPGYFGKVKPQVWEGEIQDVLERAFSKHRWGKSRMLWNG